MKKQMYFFACLLTMSFLFGPSAYAATDLDGAPSLDQVVMTADHFAEVTLEADEVKLDRIAASKQLTSNPQCTVLGLQVFNIAYAEELSNGASISDALDAANAAEAFAVAMCEAILSDEQ